MSELKKFLKKHKTTGRSKKRRALSAFLKGEAVDKKTTEPTTKETADRGETVCKKDRDKIKQVIMKKEVEIPEEKVSFLAMEYSWENYPNKMAILEKIYIIIRTHLLSDDENVEEKYGAKNLLEFLGFDADNLVHIFMAVFGDNPKFDQIFEIKNALVEDVKNMDDFIFRKMFGFSEGVQLIVAKNRIDEMAFRLSLPELMSINIAMRDKIADIYKEILEREAESGQLSNAEKIIIAAVDHGIGFKKQPTVCFDEEKITEMIEKFRSDGRTLNQESTQNVAPTQVEKPTAPTQPKPQATEKNEQMKLDEAIQKLQGLIEKFRQSSSDPIELAIQVNQTEVAQGNLLGFTFFREKGKSDTPDVKLIIAEHFDLTNEREVDAKIMEIDAEFQQTIYFLNKITI